jgi:uncharacterized OsmC-like protein
MKNTEVVTANVLSKTVNGVPVDELVATIDAIKATPAIAKFNFRIRNQWLEAARNNSTVDTFYGAGQQQPRTSPFILEADEPSILLGTDLAANPVEHLLHALAACMTTSIVYHAAARGIHIEGIESSFEGDIDLRGFLGLDESVRNGFQGIQANFKIKADVPDDQLHEIGQLAPGRSAIFDSLTNGVPISVTTERL